MLNRVLIFSLLASYSACFWYVIFGYGLGGDDFFMDPLGTLKFIFVMNQTECYVSWILLGGVCCYFTPRFIKRDVS